MRIGPVRESELDAVDVEEVHRSRNARRAHTRPVSLILALSIYSKQNGDFLSQALHCGMWRMGEKSKVWW